MLRALSGARARRYAAALLESAVKAKQLNQVEAELRQVTRLLESQPALMRFLSHPGLSAGQKIQFLRERLGQQVLPLTLNFLIAVVKRQRTESLPYIVRVFQDLAREWRGETVAQVVSAVPLTPEERDLTIKRLEELTKKRVALKEIVDPKVVGGLRIIIGDRLIDLTVRAHLDHVRSRLRRVFLVTDSGDSSQAASAGSL